jgi:peptide/nickel transport system permease protein
VVRNPFDSQLFFYVGQLARGKLGFSEHFKQPVSKLLLDGIPASLMLMIPIFFIGLTVSISLSLVCAFFRNQFIDRFLVVTAVALMSINYLVFIIVGQYFLAYKQGMFPVWGFESARYIVLPALIGIVSGLGSNIRFYRTIMLDEMYKDYVRTAFAKGVSKPRVLFVHVLKNAMIPIITNVVIAIPFLYTGSLLLEKFFGIPGLGYLGVTAVLSSDIDVVRALVLIGALMFVVANLLTDICYAAADPRVKLK